MVAARYLTLVQTFGRLVACFQPPLRIKGGVASSHVVVVDFCSMLRQLLRLMTLQQDLSVVSVVLTAHYKQRACFALYKDNET
jgi:hypothetical protein